MGVPGASRCEKFEATPLVVDGVMYTVQAPNDVVALDAATGRDVLDATRTRRRRRRAPCCGRVNRGLAILGDTLFMGTIDGHLIAHRRQDRPAGLERRRSARARSRLRVHASRRWSSRTRSSSARPAASTASAASSRRSTRRPARKPGASTPSPARASRATKPGRGDSWKTRRRLGLGHRLLRSRSEPHLLGHRQSRARTGTAISRAGDNLYSDSVVALDADTGKLKWHFQFTPHDEFDYDSTQVPVLADIEWQGQPRKVMLWANRNGFFYVLDRTTGQFLLGKPFVEGELDRAASTTKGRPINVLQRRRAEGTLIYPGQPGRRPTGIRRRTARAPDCSTSRPGWTPTRPTSKRPVEYTEGQRFTGALAGDGRSGAGAAGPTVNRRLPEEGYGAVQAFDPKTGETKWEFKMTDVTDSGVLTTASDLLFCRRPRRLLLRARRAHRRAAVEGQRRRARCRPGR